MTEGLALPAISALHESARLAVTALAALDGYRFSNAAGVHEAVVDYAIAIHRPSSASPVAAPRRTGRSSAVRCGPRSGRHQLVGR